MVSQKENNEPKTYRIDRGHSNIGFKVNHMMVAWVNGRFEDYEATLEIPGENFEKAGLQFRAKTESINTLNKDRDEHLRSSDFFDAALCPEIGFESSGIRKEEKNKYIVEGFLTMNGITNHITLDTQFSGKMINPWGTTIIALTMRSKINRHHWDMKWNKPLQSGGILVNKEVNLIIECEFN